MCGLWPFREETIFIFIFWIKWGFELWSWDLLTWFSKTFSYFSEAEKIKLFGKYSFLYIINNFKLDKLTFHKYGLVGHELISFLVLLTKADFPFTTVKSILTFCMLKHIYVYVRFHIEVSMPPTDA